MSTPDDPSGKLLSRLVGDRMYSADFVLNDYVQLHFDGPPGTPASVIFTCWAWPIVEFGERHWRERDLGYADAMRRLTPGVVTATSARVGHGIRIDLSTGAVILNPTIDEVYVEIAMLSGFEDRAWMVWRPGEDAFAHVI